MKFAGVQSRDLLHLDFECAHLIRGQVNNPKSLGCATCRPAGIPEPESMGDGTARFVVSHPFARSAKGWGTQHGRRNVEVRGLPPFRQERERMGHPAWETECRGSWSPTLSPSARKDGAPIGLWLVLRVGHLPGERGRRNGEVRGLPPFRQVRERMGHPHSRGVDNPKSLGCAIRL